MTLVLNVIKFRPQFSGTDTAPSLSPFVSKVPKKEANNEDNEADTTTRGGDLQYKANQ
jgi:hypothetical protein